MRPWILLALLALTRCATLPEQYLFDNQETFNAGIDDVWEEVVEFFAESNLPITTLEKDSGIIAANGLADSPASISDFADCGEYPLERPIRGELDLNVFVAERGEERTAVTVNTRFQMLLNYNGGLLVQDTQRYVGCNSTGNLEQSVMGRIRTGLDLPMADF